MSQQVTSKERTSRGGGEARRFAASPARYAKVCNRQAAVLQPVGTCQEVPDAARRHLRRLLRRCLHPR